MHGTLREENFRELADQFRIHDERGHGAVAEQMMFYARRIDDFGVEIHQRFAVRKEEWSVRVDLAPDKHVLGGQGDQDRKSTRLNSSHGSISYAVFCLTKKQTR